MWARLVYSDYPEARATSGDLTTNSERFWREAKRLMDFRRRQNPLSNSSSGSSGTCGGLKIVGVSAVR